MTQYSQGIELKFAECVNFLLLSLIKIRRDLERKYVERDLILVSLKKICLDLDNKFVECDLILMCLMEICLDLDKKFVECEDNFAS